LQLVFDDEERLRHRARTVFEIGLSEYPQLRGRVRAPLFVDSKTHLPLQAADLLAHETYKEVRNRACQPPRPVSQALSRLVTGRMHVAHYCDGELIQTIRLRSQDPAGMIDLPEIYRPYEVCRP
jgi:hypothetical protein